MIPYKVLATGSPCPIMVDTLYGSAMMIFITSTFQFFGTILKVNFADLLRNNSRDGGKNSLLKFGLVTQLGSFAGAITAFLIVNHSNFFTPRYNCQPCF